ncbi:unnamed protein product, partial [Aureobasidium vineae]
STVVSSSPPSARARTKKSSAPPSKSNTDLKSSAPSPKSDIDIKSWKILSTKSAARSDQAKAIVPVVDLGQTPESTASHKDVELVEPAAATSETPGPTGVEHTMVNNRSTTPKPPHSILGQMFNEIFGHASDCRMNLKIKFQSFLYELDKTASHYEHLPEYPTVEAKIPQLAQRLTLNNLSAFLQAAARRASWEAVRDLQETEVLVFQNLNRAIGLLKAKPSLDKTEIDVIMGHLTVINTTMKTFCTRVSARLTLTPEQSAIFNENDLETTQLLVFRLMVTANLPAVEERLRLLWAVAPVYHMRLRFSVWSQNLSGQTMLETRAAAVASTFTGEDEVVKEAKEARGLKRKAEEELEEQ